MHPIIPIIIYTIIMQKKGFVYKNCQKLVKKLTFFRDNIYALLKLNTIHQNHCKKYRDFCYDNRSPGQGIYW